MKAAIYVKQKTNGFGSVESKVKQCKRFAEERQLDIAGIYADTVPRNNCRRLDLEKLLDDCKKHTFEYVIILSYANLTRKYTEFCKCYDTFKKNGIQLIPVHDESLDEMYEIVRRVLCERR